MAEGPIQSRGLPVQRDRLISQMIVRSPLYLERYMIPCIAVGITGNSRRHPLGILVVPDVPLITGCDPALVAVNESHPAEELIDIKLQSLREFQVVAIKIDVVGEVVHRGNQAAVTVERSL